MKPEFVRIEDKKYKINTDFRIALECNEIAEDINTGEYEKALAVVYKLFGDEGINDTPNHNRLLELGLKYLSMGETSSGEQKEPDMDYKQDRGKINASFFSVYGMRDIFGIDYMHFYDFMDYMNGLTEDCVLNYARYVRNYDISDIKDHKEKKQWLELKEAYALTKKETITEEQKAIIEKYKKQANRKE